MDPSVTELRVVLTVDAHDDTVRLYRDLLGLPHRADITSPAGCVTILEVGRATIEIADADHAAYVDDLEVGERSAGTVRLALRVSDVDVVTSRLTDAGVELVAPATDTPWGSRNARFAGTSGVQLTLFGESGDAADRA